MTSREELREESFSNCKDNGDKLESTEGREFLQLQASTVAK